MCAVREDVLDPLVQVLVTVNTMVNLCAFTKERMHLRQGDDLRVLVTNIRQNAVEKFRFDVINLGCGEYGADERGRKEGRSGIANSQKAKGHLRENGYRFLGRIRGRVCVLEELLEIFGCGGEWDQPQEVT